MSLTDADKELAKYIAKEVVATAVEHIIKEHIEACPHGKNILIAKFFVVGLMIGVGLVSGGAGVLITKLLSGL